ncbi:phage tail protein [Megamonas funiformis]|uniref:phage tail protein n=1 Tax=Megamonas funiformis TaxID=437897 RepID=UPI002941CC6B|nr:phage tail protein [Megamonas funiformis]
MTSLGNNTDGLEVGMVIAWTLSSNPSDSYLECNGQAIDGSKYPKLYELMHNVPDYRGMFLRGLGGNSANLGILQGDAIRNITGTMGGSSSDVAGLWDYGTGVFYQFNQGRYSVYYSKAYFSYVSQGMGFDASRVVPVANENRPVNKAVRYFIKAK